MKEENTNSKKKETTKNQSKTVSTKNKTNNKKSTTKQQAKNNNAKKENTKSTAAVSKKNTSSTSKGKKLKDNNISKNESKIAKEEKKQQVVIDSQNIEKSEPQKEVVTNYVNKSQKIRKVSTEENKVVKRFLTILIMVVVIVSALYLITDLVVSKKDKEETNKTSEVNFNYDITILGSAFNRPYDEYYVITYKGTADKAVYLSSVINKYTSSENHIKIYYADLDDFMNEKFYDVENVNPKATNVEELKVGDYTLIKFKNGKIAKYIEGTEKIAKELEVKEN